MGISAAWIWLFCYSPLFSLQDHVRSFVRSTYFTTCLIHHREPIDTVSLTRSVCPLSDPPRSIMMITLNNISGTSYVRSLLASMIWTDCWLISRLLCLCSSKNQGHFNDIHADQVWKGSKAVCGVPFHEFLGSDPKVSWIYDTQNLGGKHPT